MIGLTLSSLVLVALLSTTTFAEQCKPGDNCKAPNCRCWDDPKAPGGFETRDIPQMILISFQYGLSVANVDKYTKLLNGVLNPNKCPVRGSFYLTQRDTQFNVAADLYAKGFEMGVSAINPTTATTAEEWNGNFSTVISELTKAGVPAKNITGVRAPELKFGGNNEVRGMVANKLEYDSTCLNNKYDAGNFLWPFTFDYVDSLPFCEAGQQVNASFPGVWEFPVADLQVDGHKCASPSACSQYIKKEKDAFDLYFNAFSMHYNQKTRPPFVMFIDPQWVTNEIQFTGTKQFLQFVGASFEDTWIVTGQQALAWIKDPVKAKETVDFAPWGC